MYMLSNKCAVHKTAKLYKITKCCIHVHVYVYVVMLYPSPPRPLICYNKLVQEVPSV